MAFFHHSFGAPVVAKKKRFAHFYDLPFEEWDNARDNGKIIFGVSVK